MKQQTTKKIPLAVAKGRKRAQAKARAALAMARAHVRRETIAVAAVIITAGLLWLSGNIFAVRVVVGNQLAPPGVSDRRLEDLIASGAEHYRLTLRYPNGRGQSFPLHELGIHPDTHASVAATRRAQNAPLRWLAWWQPVPVHLVTRTDEQVLRQFIARHATIVTQPAKNASVKLEQGKAVVTPGADGRQYGFTNPTRSLLTAVRSLQAKPLPLTTVAREPDISTSSAEATKAQLAHILQQDIEIKVGDQTVKPEAANVASWLTLTPAAKSITIGIDQDQLRGYLNTVAEQQSKDPRSQVVSDASGAVLVKGANGAKVQNTATVDDALTAKLLQAGGAQLAMTVKTTPFRTVNAPTAGKWIEVDTTTKRMYAYDEGEVVRTFLVSAGAPGTPTVTGRFAIYAKYTSQDMTGANADGSRYFQPDVPYVNYFYRDFAIHGNYWRPASYFGFVNSSHGCVGISVSEGAWMYAWAPVGTPVIVHT